MYIIKQIKICVEYLDMLPRPRLVLSGAPGLGPVASGQVPDKLAFEPRFLRQECNRGKNPLPRVYFSSGVPRSISINWYF